MHRGRGRGRRNPRPSGSGSGFGGGGLGEIDVARQNNLDRDRGMDRSRGRGRGRGATPESHDRGKRKRSRSKDPPGKLRRLENNDRPSRDRDQSSQSRPQRRRFHFGFKRLHGYLSSRNVEVILSIQKDLKEWQDFLNTFDLTSNSFSVLHLVLHILAEKICLDFTATLLADQQNEILAATNCPNFIDAMSKMSNLCLLQSGDGGDESRFLNSNYAEIDKSPEAFLNHLHTYCGFVMKKMPKFCMDYLHPVINQAFVAISMHQPSVQPEKKEALAKLHEKYLELTKAVQELLRRNEEAKKVKSIIQKPTFRGGFTAQEQEMIHRQEAPNDFREISIIPTIKELLCEEVFLRPNKTTGAYNDADHYLDVQFRLLLEDFRRPFRQGIIDFKKQKGATGRKKSNENIKTYPNVRIVSSELQNDRHVYKVQLSKASYKGIRWETSKRLITGSLLVFTPDAFETAYFATMNFRHAADLRRGIISVVWETHPHPHVAVATATNANETFLMLESDVYFESYRHTLAILKKLKLGDFPMCKFIVGASSDVSPPKYLIQAIADAGVEENQLINENNENDNQHQDVPGNDDDNVRGIADESADLNLQNPMEVDVEERKVEVEDVHEILFQIDLADGSKRKISPLLPEQWPSEGELGLDKNQFTAFQAAITKELAVIQGPPGTGKTFLGLKIAKVFLDNRYEINPVSNAPILVVCYTNHALDQFLEGILDIMEKSGDKYPDIVRVGGGGRNKSEKLKYFSLNNVFQRKRRENTFMPTYYWPNRSEMQHRIHDLRYQRDESLGVVNALRDLQGVVNFQSLPEWKNLQEEYPQAFWSVIMESAAWLGFEDREFRSGTLNADEFLRRKIGVNLNLRRTVPLAGSSSSSSSSLPAPAADARKSETQPADDLDQEDYDVDEIMQQRTIDDIYTESDFFFEGEGNGKRNRGRDRDEQPEIRLAYTNDLSLKDIESCIQHAKNRILKRRYENRYELCKLQSWILLHQNRSRFLQKIFHYYNQNQLNLPDVTDFLTRIKVAEPAVIVRAMERALLDRRWAVYFSVVKQACKLSADRVRKIEGELITAQKMYKKSLVYGDGQVLRQSAVVGMTTTGAAKYKELVDIMEPKIVIVEEAAEILESHIVTSLTKSCEHLILIGDHLQLRPSTTVYELSRKYNLDISLFERMVKNNLNRYELKVQHRMRPEIADLVVGTIYEQLDNHPSVQDYPAVRGVAKNVFFLEHTHLENSVSDSKSKSNQFEAKFLSSLCRHFILNGYDPSRITILTTYTGQMFLREITELPNCLGVKVTCVDNYQGEENDIILLSLVRSNEEGKIGFLNIDNRICVALSRARHGLYIVGNMDVLSEKCKTWATIKSKLQNRGECGEELTLVCPIHGTTSEVKTGEDFRQKSPDGGCTKTCGQVLSCTHHCRIACHVVDSEHKDKEYKCLEPCLKLKHCSAQPPHPCPELCSTPCPPCHVRVTKILPCQHEKLANCHQDPEEIICEEVVRKVLLCGHAHDMPCYKDPGRIQCEIPVEKELHCGLGHKLIIPCYFAVNPQMCLEIVEKTLLCDHKKTVRCGEPLELIKCLTEVEKTLEGCGHRVWARCSEESKSIRCHHRCINRLSCGHSCTRNCHANDDPDHLNYICKKACSKSCSEDHPCSRKGHECHLPCPPCIIPMKKKLNCGHELELPCHTDVGKYKCMELIKKISPECNHSVEIQCWLVYLSTTDIQSYCNELVKPLQKSLCSHDVLVPCRISKIATGKQIAEYCKEICNAVFPEEEGGCGHPCQGKCRDCSQGRFHVKCKNKCEKILVCGHACKFSCGICPPCKQPCLLKCEHSECRKPCGTPCVDCNEPCPWQCEHKSCTKTCQEPCDRKPCDLPCTKLHPKCTKGHPCIGFCGEPCPPQCRICDKEELTEFILYGNEEDKDSRFVFLQDCGHSIEADGLKHHMEMDDGSIGMKSCPRCKTVISYCRRFSTIIRARSRDVFQVRKQHYGDVREIQRTLVQTVGRLNTDKSRYLKHVCEFLERSLVRVPNAQNIRFMKEVDHLTMASISVIFDFSEGAKKVLNGARASKKLPEVMMADLHTKYLDLFSRIIERDLPLSNLEIRDMGRECERFHDLSQVYMVRCMRSTHGQVKATAIYEDIMEIMNSTKPYSAEVKASIRENLEKMKNILEIKLGITDMERREIVTAMGMSQGHYFKCPNGHIYCIGDCGRAMQESKCPECGAKIGGQSHALLADNLVAPEMDGATASNYSTALY